MTETPKDTQQFLREHPLEMQWILWEHERVNNARHYEGSMTHLADFNSVEMFWRVWAFLPRVSEVSKFRGLDAFSIFKKGIMPTWEDPANVKGTQITFEVPIVDIDSYWEDLAIAALGQVLEDGNDICGVRAVDRTARRKSPGYRLEVWMRGSISDETGLKILERVKQALADGDNSRLDQMPHLKYERRPA